MIIYYIYFNQITTTHTINNKICIKYIRNLSHWFSRCEMLKFKNVIIFIEIYLNMFDLD